MSDKGKLALATFAFALAAVLEEWRPTIGGDAFLIGCVLAAWALRLKSGTAGEEQWNRIRSKVVFGSFLYLAWVLSILNARHLLCPGLRLQWVHHLAIRPRRSR